MSIEAKHTVIAAAPGYFRLAAVTHLGVTSVERIPVVGWLVTHSLPPSASPITHGAYAAEWAILNPDETVSYKGQQYANVKTWAKETHNLSL